MSNYYEKITNYVMLARKAGKVSKGTDTTLNLIKSLKAKLIILSSNASSNLNKKITDKTNFYKIKLLILDKIYFEKIYPNDLVKVIAITDDNFSNQIFHLKEVIENEKNKGEQKD